MSAMGNKGHEGRAADSALRDQPVQHRTEAVAIEEQWLRENEGAIRSSNEYVERNGLPLAKYRMPPRDDGHDDE